MTSEPVKRTLKVLELFAQSHKTETLASISRKCDISIATVSRIVGTLEEEGYLYRAKDKSYSRNFSLQKKMSLPPDYLTLLDQVLEELSETSEQSSEALFVENNQLYWFSKKESEKVAFRLKARPGFKRHLYELDSPSRLALATYDWQRIKDQFDLDAFFETGLKRERVSRSALKVLLQTTSTRDVAYDIEGNVRGIRRFAKAIFDKNGQFTHMLCLAEAAISKPDMKAHVDHYVALINTAAARLTDYLNRE